MKEEKKQATFQSEATQRTEEGGGGGGSARRMSITADGGGVGIVVLTDGRIVPLSSLFTFSHKDDRSRFKRHVLRFDVKDFLRHIVRGKFRTNLYNAAHSLLANL